MNRRNLLENAAIIGAGGCLIGGRNEEEMTDIASYILDETGRYTYDLIIPEEVFEENKDELYETDRTTVTDFWPEAKVYRDNNKFNSAQVSDYRGIEREGLVDDVIVGHLERFNPDKAPIRHALIDFPSWQLSNRILEDRNL